MKKLVVSMSFFIFFSCNKETKDLTPNFKAFIYVNLNLRENNSLKFSGSDTLYLQKRFPEEPVGNYIAILNKQDKDSLIKRINKLNLKKYSPNYIENIADGNSQVFIISRNKKPESIYIHGRIGPSEIKDFGSWFEKLQSELKFIKTKEYITFWNIENIVPPPPPPPIVKNIKFK
jgi:hypothetical protein